MVDPLLRVWELLMLVVLGVMGGLWGSFFVVHPPPPVPTPSWLSPGQGVYAARPAACGRGRVGRREAGASPGPASARPQLKGVLVVSAPER